MPTPKVLCLVSFMEVLQYLAHLGHLLLGIFGTTMDLMKLYNLVLLAWLAYSLSLVSKCCAPKRKKGVKNKTINHRRR